MASFTFRAIDLTGEATKGELEAADKQAITEQLRERGLIPLDIVENKTAVAEADLLERFKKIKARDITIMTRQLATMVASGMSLLRCFYVLEDQTENDKLREVLSEVRKDVEAGLSLSDAMERHPTVFNQLYVAMVRTGEASGMLEECLTRVADQLESADSLRRQIRAAMIYPALIGGFAVVVLLALVAFLIPVFEGVFKDLGGQLPKITQISVGMSHAVTHRWFFGLPGIIGVAMMFAGLVVAFKKWKKSDWGRPKWDAFKLRIPMKIGDTVQKVSLARWSRTFSGLVHAGVPILQAVEITGATSGNYVVETAMKDVHASIKRGGTISEPMRGASVFPTMVVPDGGRRRGDGKPRRDAGQGRRLLRGRGGRRGQGADVDPRADHDHLRGRHGRLCRDLDVHADVQDLRPDQIARIYTVFIRT